MATAQLLTAGSSWATGADEVLAICFPPEKKVVVTGHHSELKAWWCVGAVKGVATQTATLPVPEEVTCICPFHHSSRMAVSSNQTVRLFSCTYENGRLTSFTECQKFCFSEEEINSVDVNSKETYICTCDDNGEVKVIDLDKGSLLRSLSSFHDCICSSVKFNPRKPYEVVSGGLDSKVGRWDFNRGRLLAKVDTREDCAKAELMINPPMVHSVAVLRNQNCIACGLGDGRLVVYSLRLPKALELVGVARIHSTSVACVRCVDEPSSDSTKERTRSYVITAGNDSVLCVCAFEKDRRGNGASLECLDKLEGITKVNDLDVQWNDNKDTVVACTADVTGTVSLYNYAIC